MKMMLVSVGLWGLFGSLVNAAPHKKLTTPNPVNFFSLSPEKIISAQEAAYNSVPATSQLLFVCLAAVNNYALCRLS
jgi:hypothetical protein